MRLSFKRTGAMFIHRSKVGRAASQSSFKDSKSDAGRTGSPSYVTIFYFNSFLRNFRPSLASSSCDGANLRQIAAAAAMILHSGVKDSIVASPL